MMIWDDPVAPFDGIPENRPPRPPEAEIAELSPEPGEKLLLNSLPPSLSAVLSRFVIFLKCAFRFQWKWLDLSRLDLNGDGFVYVDEVKDRLVTIDSIEKGRIPIRALPTDIQVLPASLLSSRFGKYGLDIF
jgi:hypothetical protein